MYPEQTFNGLLDSCKKPADLVQAPSPASDRKKSVIKEKKHRNLIINACTKEWYGIRKASSRTEYRNRAVHKTLNNIKQHRLSEGKHWGNT